MEIYENRETKFRAKSKLNGKWVYGSYVKGDVEDWCFICAHDSDISGEGIDIHSTRVITSTVGEYAGFRDKNSIEVYEGDIVEAWSAGTKATFVVKFRLEGSPCWILYPAYQFGELWYISTTKHTKGKKFINVDSSITISQKEGFYDDGLVVIGNIHDNKELLLRCFTK